MNEAQTRLNLIDPAIRAAGARNLNSAEDSSAHGSDIPAQETRAPRKIGVAQGKWHFPEDWEAQDKALDAEIAKDFYAV